MREGIALEYGIALYRQYGEEQAAAFLKIDVSTLKRWRRKGITPHIRMGERGVRYLGQHIVDLLLKGTEGWDDTPDVSSSLENTGSTSAAAPRLGIAAGSKVSAPDALASAQRILGKPSKS